MPNKTLKQYVDELNEKTVMLIGSRSGFFFIGNKEKFYKYIDQISDNYADDFKRTFENKQKEVHRLMTTAIKPTTNETIDEFGRRVIEIGKKICAVSDNYTELYKRHTTFKPIIQRKVREAYLNAEGTVIIVSGYEVGRYWFKHEFDEDYE